jgi:hypothetical protein
LSGGLPPLGVDQLNPSRKQLCLALARRDGELLLDEPLQIRARQLVEVDEPHSPQVTLRSPACADDQSFADQRVVADRRVDPDTLEALGGARREYGNSTCTQIHTRDAQLFMHCNDDRLTLELDSRLTSPIVQDPQTLPRSTFKDTKGSRPRGCPIPL